MLYVPIKIYPNERSVRGCVVIASTFVGLAIAGFFGIEAVDLRLCVVSMCLAAGLLATISVVAAMRRQPMLKVMDDRFSVYTPFGYAMVRFGEVLSFKKGGMPYLRTLNVHINKSARPRFPSSLGRMFYAMLWLRVTNTIAIQGYMLGAELEPVINLLEKRRLAAVRLDAHEGYGREAVASVG